MRFSIVGAGALGTILGAHLIEAGHDVRIIARGRRAAYLSSNGLRVYGLREFATPCVPRTALSDSDDNGVVVYAVKTYHMAEALDGAAGCPHHAVFSLANGVQKNEQLVDVFGRDKALGCMANFSGELLDDGTVSFTRNVCVFIGGGTEGLAADIAATINDAGIISASSDEIECVEWSKFVGWVAFFAIAVISRATSGVSFDNDGLAKVAVAIIREAAAIAAARGITLEDRSPMPVASIATLPFDAAVEKVREIGREFQARAPNHRMSSLQDMEAGRPLEVHETLGYLVAEAARLDVEAPTLGLAYDLCAGLNDLPR